MIHGNMRDWEYFKKDLIKNARKYIKVDQHTLEKMIYAYEQDPREFFDNLDEFTYEQYKWIERNFNW